MELVFYENIVLTACIIISIIIVLYYAVKRFLSERELEKSEIMAELDMLSEKLSNKQNSEKQSL
ncbi:MAG: DUF3966 domain-containing protein [Ectobacillus sp.]